MNLCCTKKILEKTVLHSQWALSSSWLSSVKDERQSMNYVNDRELLSKVLQGFPCLKKVNWI